MFRRGFVSQIRRPFFTGFCQRPLAMSMMPARMRFSTANDASDDLSQAKRFSLDAFYMDTKTEPMTDAEAKTFMEFGARLAMVTFRSEEEMMSFKNDFQAALGFLDKLDEVDVRGVEPLGNVFEIYGGNEHNLRREDDFERVGDDQMRPLDFNKELTKMNKHMDGRYVVLNRPREFNPDSE